ncbi:uncharacterized protein [Medicago truncatula]|uniref:uncharacterized protein isoform X1 n=1 Tax=Medicago truncatula TaxID=3880 RepID=UPI000D2F15CD|nr:uncharacterized protein LOC25499755 isoform X1 [Medicago truncatula]
MLLLYRQSPTHPTPILELLFFLMAVNCTCTTKIPNQKYGSFLKYPNKELMLKRNYVPLKKTSTVLRRITASIKNKLKQVYESEPEGVVCYQDEHGEIICEGYDEGPCFQRISKPIYYQYPIPPSRDAEITNILLRQSWLQISDDADDYESVNVIIKLQWF